ncbi:MAG: tetratricopeptide repeat protein, partial [Gallionella sp.]|nr:tetratricopeptide repeat protein [Gallionella sp.]
MSRRADHTGAAAAFQAAIGIDDRHAETWFHLGQALFTLKRYDEARQAFERASDEDVCPLRALTPMQRAVAEEAHRHNAPVIDYAALVDSWSRNEYGHTVLGKEYFLDQVHPTIDGNRRLALALLDQLVASGV